MDDAIRSHVSLDQADIESGGVGASRDRYTGIGGKAEAWAALFKYLACGSV
jgi:hypothetical protein